MIGVGRELPPTSRATSFEPTHRLRHTFATSLMNGGMSLLGIVKLLGHGDQRVTLPRARMRRRASEAHREERCVLGLLSVSRLQGDGASFPCARISPEGRHASSRSTQGRGSVKARRVGCAIESDEGAVLDGRCAEGVTPGRLKLTLAYESGVPILRL
jgi:hypothetical protein